MFSIRLGEMNPKYSLFYRRVQPLRKKEGGKNETIHALAYVTIKNKVDSGFMPKS